MNQKKAYQIAIDRDEGLCSLCGKKAVNVHHIIPAGLGGKRVHEPYNLICLCGECHIKAHQSQDVKRECIEVSMRQYGGHILALMAKKKRGF